MSEPVSIALTLLTALAGGTLAHVFRLPGGAILWALLPVAALRLLIDGFVPLPSGHRVAAQILIGIAIGSTLTRNPVLALRPLVVPVGLSLVVLLGIALMSGIIFAAVTDLPLLTTLFSTAPGGASDMAAAALQLGADVPLIAGFHLVRQVLIFVVLTTVFARLFRPSPDGEIGG
jgi:uncharacterized protein